MLNLLSLALGTVGLLGVLVAFIPLLGWANWFIVPIGVLGLVFGVLSRAKSGRNLNLAVIGIGALRLTLGGGII